MRNREPVWLEKCPIHGFSGINWFCLPQWSSQAQKPASGRFRGWALQIGGLHVCLSVVCSLHPRRVEGKPSQAWQLSSCSRVGMYQERGRPKWRFSVANLKRIPSNNAHIQTPISKYIYMYVHIYIYTHQTCPACTAKMYRWKRRSGTEVTWTNAPNETCLSSGCLQTMRASKTSGFSLASKFEASQTRSTERCIQSTVANDWLALCTLESRNMHNM